jgi:release factor glutamine methyltransferase
VSFGNNSSPLQKSHDPAVIPRNPKAVLMKNSKVLFQEIVGAISLNETPEEIQSVAYIVFESLFGISIADVMAGKVVAFPQDTAQTLQKWIERLNRGEPVQYVVGEELFFRRKFQVNPSVLIPRPETEELIRVVLSYRASFPAKKEISTSLKILDIGTGSGCVPVTLFLEIPGSEVYATDVSNAALSVAVSNCERYHARVTLIEHDILNEQIPVANLDVIVSNPPYVTISDKSAMASNVLDYEPHQALFVPDDDPLIFYKAIAREGRSRLNTGGLLAVEINERFGDEVMKIFLQNGFGQVSILRDVANKPRVVRGLHVGAPL